MDKSKDLQWFIDRIGKRIYRLTDTKCCRHCQRVFKDGLVIDDLMHAKYLYICQGELELVYGDKKE